MNRMRLLAMAMVLTAGSAVALIGPSDVGAHHCRCISGGIKECESGLNCYSAGKCLNGQKCKADCTWENNSDCNKGGGEGGPFEDS